MLKFIKLKNSRGLLIILLVTITLFQCDYAYANTCSTNNSTEAKSKNEICLPIIMYHEVKPFKTGKDVITPYEIESDLKYFKQNNYTPITMTDLIKYEYGSGEMPEKPVIISFDDGYYNNYVYVYPLLKKYNMKIVLSIIGKNTDDFTRITDNNLDYSHVTWDQINEMIKSGFVEIQNHSYNLHLLSRKRYGCKRNKGESQEHYEQVLSDDISRLQYEMKQHTGFTPNTFAYPYGAISDESLFILKKLGFKASFSCKYGINIITQKSDELYSLKRICRAHGKPVQKVLKEAMKTLKFRKKAVNEDELFNNPA